MITYFLVFLFTLTSINLGNAFGITIIELSILFLFFFFNFITKARP